MFDVLLKSKFYTKCKSDIKLTRARIDIIRKKKISMQNYLRNGVADLLKSGLDIDAYERAERLLIELNKSNCYEFTEQSLLNILNHLVVMNKQRECPEDCRESVSSLIFAAARLADLPELRELRTIFSERYGNSLDFYVNKQFVEKMTSGLPSKDMKLQLLQDIAIEYGLKWNSKDLKNNLFSEPANEKNLESKSNCSKFSFQDSTSASVQKRDFVSTQYDHTKPGENIALNSANDLSNYGPKETSKIEGRFPRKHDFESAHPRDDKVSQMVKKPNEVPSVQDIRVNMVSRSERMKERNFGRSVSVVGEHKLKRRECKAEECESTPEFDDKNSHLREPECSTSDKRDGADRGKNSLLSKAKPVPTSVRTRHLKPPPIHESAVKSDSEKKNHLKVNKDTAGEGRRILKFLDEGWHSQQDERMMDKLLLHYSKKKGPHQTRKADSVLAPAESSRASNRSKDCLSRTASVPCEKTSPSETPKVHARASSFNPAMYDRNVHVHPKLPEYDDFVARLASLRGH